MVHQPHLPGTPSSPRVAKNTAFLCGDSHEIGRQFQSAPSTPSGSQLVAGAISMPRRTGRSDLATDRWSLRALCTCCHSPALSCCVHVQRFGIQGAQVSWRRTGAQSSLTWYTASGAVTRWSMRQCTECLHAENKDLAVVLSIVRGWTPNCLFWLFRHWWGKCDVIFAESTAALS